MPTESCPPTRGSEKAFLERQEKAPRELPKGTGEVCCQDCFHEVSAGQKPCPHPLPSHLHSGSRPAGECVASGARAVRGSPGRPGTRGATRYFTQRGEEESRLRSFLPSEATAGSPEDSPQPYTQCGGSSDQPTPVTAERSCRGRSWEGAPDQETVAVWICSCGARFLPSRTSI